MIMVNELALSVIITGPDEFTVAGKKALLLGQSLVPCEIFGLVSPTSDELREILSSAKGEYIYVMRSSSSFLSSYSLEKAVLERILRRETTKARNKLLNGFWDIVFSRDELCNDVAEVLAWPEDIPLSVQEVVLPDPLRRKIIGIAKSLWELDVLPLVGDFFVLIHKLSKVYLDEESQSFLCAALHTADYIKRREFLSDKDWRTLRKELDKLHNLAWDDVILPDVTISTQPPYEESEAPLLTYIVPVFNVDLYLSRCIESLRRQTLRDIEIICIDDGSSDDSPRLLDAFAEHDKRIKVVHKDNEGVGAARNLALSMARGKYVAFVDGDDWLHSEAAMVSVSVAEKNALDFCSYDIAAFNHITRDSIPIYWSIANHAKVLPVGRVATMDAIPHLMIHASACLAVYRKSFLEEVGFKFTDLKLGEDLTFTMTLWPLARRFMLLKRSFYFYRRGQPCSAVSNLTAGVASKSADDAQIGMMEALLRLYQDVYKTQHSEKKQKLFRGRILADVLYYAEKSIAVRSWLAKKGWSGFEFDKIKETELGAPGFFTRRDAMEARLLSENQNDEIVVSDLMPTAMHSKVKRVMRGRETSVKDLYIITGQLNSTTNEPIDSWTLFTWLQKQGIPSRYVIWEKHLFYEKLCQQGATKDLIVLSGDGVSDYEFLEKGADALVRAKAVIQENAALNPDIRKWLKNLDGCAYIFLQHGVFYTWFTPIAGKTLSFFNYVNVASKRERDFILERTPEEIGLADSNFIIAGLPRWDTLEDYSKDFTEENVVLVMLTWRMSFGLSKGHLENSAYYNRLRNFLKSSNIQKLRDLGIKIVLAPHHHLANKIKDLDFDVPVDVVDSSEVSYWIRKAKMLVTDFSSVSIDFLFLEKPVVYWMIDADDLMLDRANTDDGGKVISALRETKSLFNQVFKSSDVLALIEHYAKNDFRLEEENLRISKALFANKKDISKSLYEKIESISSNTIGESK